MATITVTPDTNLAALVGKRYVSAGIYFGGRITKAVRTRTAPHGVAMELLHDSGKWAYWFVGDGEAMELSED